MSWDELVERYKEHNNFMMEQIKEKNKELSELRKQNKQYREALETIRNMFPMRGGTSYDKLARIRKIAEKALEGDE